MSFTIVLAVLALSLSMTSALQAQASPAIGDTKVMKWKDGKKAVFLLAYDDSCPSHLTNAIPELEKRNLVGTFYINAGNAPFKNVEAKWRQIAKSPAVVFGNHTFTHAGASSPEQLDDEFIKANDTIHSLTGQSKPFLISFGQPGGVPWKVDKPTEKQLVTKNNLVTRPGFWGPPFHHKTLAEGLKLIDDAIAKGEMSHLDFHGVGGDWHVVPMDYYIPLLDRLQAENARVWQTDHITYHKYQEERRSAKVAVLAADDKQIRLTLSADTDPALYDQPLTLTTQVPAAWKTCVVIQGDTRKEIPAINGTVHYDALPGNVEITLSPKA